MKINEQELDEFKKTLPEDIREERYRFFTNVYNVAKALFLIKKQNLKLGQIDVRKWCEVMGMAGERNDDEIHLLNGVNDADAMKDNINPSVPVVICEHTFGRGKKKEFVTIIIDGNKRLRKAFLTGHEKIPAYYLPEKLAKLIKER